MTKKTEPYRLRFLRLRTLALCFVFLWFFLGGLAHFLFTEEEMGIIPPWLPAPRALVLVSGAFELIGAMGLLAEKTRYPAGIGLLLLTVAVTPANIYMWQNPAMFSFVPPWVLAVRLPFQLLLMAAIWWSTRPCPRSEHRDVAD